MTNKVIHGDNLQVLKLYPDNFFHSVVTDPPYGLKFMNKHWDYDVPQVEFWQEVLRVLKPGGYVLSFGSTRTYHRMVVNIEDAGFIIRDQLQWIYGQGFPKSLNLGKSVNKFLKTGNASWNGTGDSSNGALGYFKLQHKQGYRSEDYSNRHQNKIKITEQEASDWEGYGTALKPANEPICLAMKPLSEKNFAENVLKHGAGGLNIEGCRVGESGGTKKIGDTRESKGIYGNGINGGGCESINGKGRFPSNVILDEEAGGMLDKQSGVLTSGAGDKRGLHNGSIWGNKDNRENPTNHIANFGGASRFFYCAKASSSERNAGMRWDSENVIYQSGMGGGVMPIDDEGNERDRFKATSKNHHATVKPLSLMRYLVRLITPKGGIVLEPFAGSGTTLLAAKKEGFEFVGIERELEYCKIAEQRLESVAINETLF